MRLLPVLLRADYSRRRMGRPRKGRQQNRSARGFPKLCFWPPIIIPSCCRGGWTYASAY